MYAMHMQQDKDDEERASDDFQSLALPLHPIPVVSVPYREAMDTIFHDRYSGYVLSLPGISSQRLYQLSYQPSTMRNDYMGHATHD